MEISQEIRIDNRGQSPTIENMAERREKLDFRSLMVDERSG
jgi:hypothetical protein